MSNPVALGPVSLAILGMGTVFLVLLLIAWVLSLFKNFAAEKKAAPVAAPAAAPAASAGDDQEVVAVIMAAVSACMGGQAFRIRSISADGSFVARPYVRGAQTGGWVNAARMENTINK